MEEKLKQVIWLRDWYLDFHSVTDGFRKACLIGLTQKEDFGKCSMPFGAHLPPDFPSALDQAMFLSEYIEQNNPYHKLIPGWAHLYFLAHKSKAKDVEKLLQDHPCPIDSKEGERRLGLILGYPECCVDGHSKGILAFRSADYILPFSPCSPTCEEPWMREYERLIRKYNVDTSKEVLC